MILPGAESARIPLLPHSSTRPPFIIPAPHFVTPAPHFVIPAPHFVIPAPHFVIPAKAGIQEGRGWGM